MSDSLCVFSWYLSCKAMLANVVSYQRPQLEKEHKATP